MMNGLHATEYAPKDKTIYYRQGKRYKRTSIEMLTNTLNIVEDVRFMDATDAVAVALCHHYQHKTAALKKDNAPKVKAKNSNSWASFIAMNPDRISRIK